MDVYATSHFFLFGHVNMMSTKVVSLPVSKDIEFKQIIVKIKQPVRQTSRIAMLAMANIAIYAF